MTIDPRTGCPACSLVVRQLDAAARDHLAALERLAPALLEQLAAAGAMLTGERLAFMTQQFLRIVEAHEANQDHAMSPELVGLRQAGVLEMLRDSGAE